MQIEINEELAIRVKDTVSHGLCKGLGKPNLGEMCVEAAVNYACGFEHGDNPSCVGSAVRSFKIRLNDANWSSNQARAEGMKKIAIGQLGSNTIDQIEFAKIVAFKTITVLMPVILRNKGYETEAMLCENSKDLKEAKDNIWSVKKVLYAAADAAYAAAYADAAYAAYTADADAYADADADADAYAAADADAAYAAYAAYADAYADADAYAAADAAYAAAYADAAYAAYTAYADAYAAAYAYADADKYLIISANICLDALIELKSPGVQFLYLYN